MDENDKDQTVLSDQRDPADEDDVEGHGFLTDSSTAREVSRTRNADIERQLRERERRKEARPNR